MVPFITEHVWQELVQVAEPNSAESVHLANFPNSDPAKINPKLSQSVRLSRRLVELGRAARAQSKVKIRQPLARALVAANGWDEMDAEIRSHISEELNVISLDELAAAGGELVSISVKANFKILGAKFGPKVQEISKAITASSPQDQTTLVAKLRANSTAQFSYSVAGASNTIEIDLDDLVITETPKEGWSVASHSGESVALDLTLTPELIEAGIVREVIRAIQEERKQSGFEISDRITVRWGGLKEVAEAVSKNLDLIGSETLATSLVFEADKTNSENELGLWLDLAKN